MSIFFFIFWKLKIENRTRESLGQPENWIVVHVKKAFNNNVGNAWKTTHLFIFGSCPLGYTMCCSPDLTICFYTNVVDHLCITPVY